MQEENKKIELVFWE